MVYISFDAETIQWFREKLSAKIGEHMLERSGNITKLEKELSQI
jgi:hypothetical protein